jgi:preprotein translocase subunit SecA
MVRNPIGFRRRLARLQGSSVDFDLRSYDRPLAEIEGLEGELRALEDAALRDRADRLRGQARSGVPRDALRGPLYALVREAARRTLGVRPFDVQMVASLALDGPRVVEMETGEGKTLAAVAPACLHALGGQGVHVLTFNDYLARRDAEWMGPLYRFLGLSVGWVQSGLSREARRAAYAADVTYVTAKEAGFDRLRDLLATDAGELVHRPFHVAIVDEADSILVDEARVPLVIAGLASERTSSARRLAQVVGALTPDVDFGVDDYGRNVELTEAGLSRIEDALGCGNLYGAPHHDLLAEVNCALHARVLLRRDVDYIVRDGRIGVVDELTGRVVPDRHWPDGLQAALEAKEDLAPRADGHILGQITLEHFLGGYERLCGMTGTAQDAAPELLEFYGLRVAVIPTHRPSIREDRPDVLFTHREAKERAVVEEVTRVHRTGRPVLLGTLTIEESERLGARLREAGVTCEVLNARNDAREAEIVAAAGEPFAVTISTNMAGRGTDIRLGGPSEARRDEVVRLGGLYVIGTNRHESGRIDRQLRGRAGRQGDPGESRFFVSLEDDLLVRYGIRSLIPEAVLPAPQDSPVDNAVIRREVARAQRIVEGQDLEIRRTLRRYATPVEEQRVPLHARRQAVLAGPAGPQRDLTLFHLDRAWRDHLAFVADVRDGIHLVRLGGGDPLTRFRVRIGEAYRELLDELDRAIEEDVRNLATGDGVPRLPVKGPSSTWTYLVNDDPFRDQLGSQLTGPGRATFAVGAAVFATPLLILLGIADKYFKKRPRRG